MNPKLYGKVQVFEKQVNYVGQVQQVKNYGTNKKVLSKGIHMQNLKALCIMNPKLYGKVKVFEK